MYLSTVAEIEINIDFLQHFGLLLLQSSWPGLPELQSLRSRPEEYSHSFRALLANKTSSLQVGD